MSYSRFPIDIIRITQGQNGQTSHQGTYAIDLIGTYSEYPINAPFKCKIAKVGAYSGGNAIYLHSIEEVETPSGKKHLTVLMLHSNIDNSWFVNHMNKGTIFYHDDMIYRTGISGNVTGDHLHLEVAEGHQTTLIENGHTNIWGDKVYMLNNTIPIESGFFFDKDFNYYSFIGETISLDEWNGESGGGRSEYMFIRKRFGNRFKTIPLRKR